MSVKVNIARSNLGSSQQDATHPDGVTFVVKDGHLFVYDNRDWAIAAYAPTQWTDATVLPDPK